ncbi:MAG: DNA internalization-related competence protein ComEC/Rec2 [Candidatus Hydrogenedentes bacterium]|nr:DNA internalization-related competence protein ComEC/Rec2 [Candidatus Hydrogenedentota bacterium]
MNRPLVWVGVGFSAGTYCASTGACPGLLFPLLLGLFGALVPFGLRRSAITQPLGVALLFMAAGSLLWNVRVGNQPVDALGVYAQTHPDEYLRLEGRVRYVELSQPGSRYASFWLAAERLIVRDQTFPIAGRVEVRWNQPGDVPFVDERVRVKGQLQFELGRVNPGIASREDYLRRQGIHSALRAFGAAAGEKMAPARWWMATHWTSRLRVHIAESLTKAVPESVLPFVLAVWLGERSGVTEAEYEAYRNSGTAHILAVSGINMSLIYLTISFLLRLTALRPRMRATLTLVVILLFASLAGASASCLRAAFMVVVYLAAEFFEREPDAPTALSLSALTLLLLNPGTLSDGGFQLSFLGVASILAFYERFSSILSKLWPVSRLPGFVRESVAVTLAAQTLTLPLGVHLFHVLPVAGPLANFVVVPLVTLVLWLGFLTSAAALISSDLALLFGYALQPLVALIRLSAQGVAAIPFSYFTLTSPTMPALVLCYAALIFYYWARPNVNWRRAANVGLATLAILVAVLWRPWFPEAKVVFLDVGAGDAAFARTPGGDTLLIDGGDRSERFDAGARIVAPYLWSEHASHLDYVVASHPHRDHVGGVLHILNRFQVNTVLLSGAASSAPLEAELLARCSARGIAVRRLRRGDRLALRGAQLEVLHPPEDWPESASDNDKSLVVRLTWPGVQALFTGDIESAAEQALSEGNCRSQILKVPHHASKTSSSIGFIEAVKPRYAAVSSGGRSGPEVLDEAVINRYLARGIVVFRTDRLGGITMDGGLPLRVRGARVERGYVGVSEDEMKVE